MTSMALARPRASMTLRSASFCSFSSVYFICSADCCAMVLASIALVNSGVKRTSRRTTSSIKNPSFCTSSLILALISSWIAARFCEYTSMTGYSEITSRITERTAGRMTFSS